MAAKAASAQDCPAPEQADRPVAYPVSVAARLLCRSPQTLKRLHAAEKMPGRYLGPILMVPSAWVHAYGEWPREATP